MSPNLVLGSARYCREDWKRWSSRTQRWKSEYKSHQVWFLNVASYWNGLFLKGNDGAQGSQGPTGAPGSPGSPGLMVGSDMSMLSMLDLFPHMCELLCSLLNERVRLVSRAWMGKMGNRGCGWATRYARWNCPRSCDDIHYLSVN